MTDAPTSDSIFDRYDGDNRVIRVEETEEVVRMRRFVNWAQRYMRVDLVRVSDSGES